MKYSIRPTFQLPFPVSGKHAIRVLAVACLLVSGFVSADDLCGKRPAGAVVAPGSFEQQLLSLKTPDQAQREIRTGLCSKDSVYAFLTGEPAYRYGHCFIAAGSARNFWNADHRQAQAMLQRFRTDCISWAEKRYQPQLAAIAAGNRARLRRLRAQALRKQAAQQNVNAVAKTVQGADRVAPAPHPAPHPAGQRQALQQALEAVRGRHHGRLLQWSGGPSDEAQASAELAAWLLATDLSGHGDSEQPGPAHLQQHLNALLGRHRIAAVSASGKAGEYRVQIRAGRSDFSIDAYVESHQPPGTDSTPRVLFEQHGQRLRPVAAVLQTPGQVVTATRLEGGNLPLKVLPAGGTSRLPAAPTRVQLQLRCVPHDGGQVMPLARCLKPDGEIRILTLEKDEQFSYRKLQRRQRRYRAGIKPPYVLLVRTGDGNRRGELQLTISDVTRDNNPALFDSRAVGRGDSLFVYAE